ncbi:helix-turn-helix transcriptional regulator [Roseinatronobacter sp.]
MSMNPAPQPADDKLLSAWLTRKELAQELGVTAATLARWHTEGSAPPCTKVGKKILYRREAVQQWLISRERGQM